MGMTVIGYSHADGHATICFTLKQCWGTMREVCGYVASVVVILCFLSDNQRIYINVAIRPTNVRAALLRVQQAYTDRIYHRFL